MEAKVRCCKINLRMKYVQLFENATVTRSGYQSSGILRILRDKNRPARMAIKLSKQLPRGKVDLVEQIH